VSTTAHNAFGNPITDNIIQDILEQAAACVHVRGPQMVVKCRLASEFMKYSTPYPDVKRFVEMSELKIGFILQKFVKDFTPMGDIDICFNRIEVCKLKGDWQFCPSEEEQNKYLAQFYKPGTDSYDFGWGQFVLDEFIRKMEEDENYASAFFSVHDDASATAAGPRSPFSTYNGWYAQIHLAIADDKITPLPTGENTLENIWENLYAMADSVHACMKGQPMKLWLTCRDYQLAYRAREMQFLQSNDPVAQAGQKRFQPTLCIPGTFIELVPLVSMSMYADPTQPKSPMILTSIDNAVHAFDSASDNDIKVEPDKRLICIFNDRKGGVGFWCTDDRFLIVNDQIPNPWTNIRPDGTAAPQQPF